MIARRRDGSGGAIAALGLLLAGQVAAASPPGPPEGEGPRIEPRAVGCFVKERFAEIAARIEPAATLTRARVYFRSPRDPDFLFVEMTRSADMFIGVLPRPKEDSTPVTYFIEAVGDGRVSRSAAMSAPVVASPRACGRGTPAADGGKLADVLVYTLGTGTTPAGFTGVAEVRTAPRGGAAAASQATAIPPAASTTVPAGVPAPPPRRAPDANAGSVVAGPPPAAPVAPSAPAGPPPSENVAVGAQASEPPASMTPVLEYALGRDDIIRVSVYGHDDLAQTLVIQADGTFNFPLIGRVQASGLTPRELEQRLAQALGRGFVRAPQVSVTVQEYRSKTVFVVGEVSRPGPYPLSGSMSIMEVLAKAGPTGGVGAEVVIVRPPGEVTGPVLPEDGGPAEILRVNLRDIQMGQLKKNIQLRPNDTVFVSAAAKVFVTGEVRNPGGFPYQPGITVRQAISMAGGLSPDGSSSRLQVVRSAGSKTAKTKIGIDDVVRPGDTIVVRAKLF